LEFAARFAKPVIVPKGEDVTISFTGKVIEVDSEQITIDVVAICGGVKVLNQTKARVRL
jgi:hypothetical protein